MPKEELPRVKEVTKADPHAKYPLIFKLKDIVDNPTPDTEVEVYLQWEEGSWGRKVPCVVVKALKE